MTDTPTNTEPGQVLAEQAAKFEAAWLARAKAMDEARDKRNRRVQHQFWFLFLFLLVAFLLLAYRTETTAQALRVGFWQECTDRQERIVQSNQGREALIKVVLTNPERPVPEDRVAAVRQQLEDGLLLPLEDCGPSPQ